MLTRWLMLPPTLREFLAYAVIGAATTSLDAVLFGALVAALDWREGVMPVVASTLSYGTASVIAYVLNTRIAFRARHTGDSLATVMRFAGTFAASALLSAAVFSLVHAAAALTLQDDLALGLAKAASIATVIAWNFTLLRRWVFPTPGTAVGNAR